MLFAWHRLPFDHKNPFGFVAAIAVMYATFSYLILIGACTMIAAIEFYVYSTAMSECIKQNLCSINQRTTENYIILEQFIEFIKFHADVKQLSSLF